MTTDVVNNLRIVPQPTADAIIARVAAAHGLAPTDVKGEKLSHHIVLARCEAIRAIKSEKPWFSLQRIGAAFGGMHHSAVQHHLRGTCRCKQRRAAYGQKAGGTVSPTYTALTPAEFGSVQTRFREGFDTKEIRDQFVLERLSRDQRAFFHESQIYNALPTEELS